MKLWEQQEDENHWDFISDMASLVLVIVFTAAASLGFLVFGFWVTK